MNPRVSRSSALAARRPASRSPRSPPSWPSATPSTRSPTTSPRETPASFEPSLDYVVVKIPRFAFEKFPGADTTLTTHMKSVGEVMALGRNFTEALQKAMRSLEAKGAELDFARPRRATRTPMRCAQAARPHDRPAAGRRAGDARRRDRRPRCTRRPRSTRGSSTSSSPARARSPSGSRPARSSSDATTCGARPSGTASPTSRSRRICGGSTRTTYARSRHALGVRPVFKTVDTCAAEFAATHAVPLLVLRRGGRGRAATSGPRCSSSAAAPTASARASSSTTPACTPAIALHDAGYETVMVNCNPETVSTDYDTSDRLYFEPLTARGRARGRRTPSSARGEVVGVIVQLGGQTPLGLAQRLKDAGVPIVGTSPEAIHLAEERGAFGQVLAEAGLLAPKHGTAHVVRRGQGDRRRDRLPGAGPAVVRARRSRHGDRLRRRRRSRPTSTAPPRSARSTRCSSTGSSTTRSRSTSTRSTTAPSCSSAASWSTSRRPASTPATRPARCRRSRWAAPTSSGSARPPRGSPRASACAGCSTCSSRSPATCSTSSRPTRGPAAPCRSSSKATAVPLAKAAARVMLGATIAELRAEGMLPAGATAPTCRSRRRSASRRRCCRGTGSASGVDTVLGPEMKSTGEVMGVDAVFGTAFAKSPGGGVRRAADQGPGLRLRRQPRQAAP